MKNWFNLSKSDRLDIINQTAFKTNLPEAAIEKDLWVMFVMNAIFNSKFSKHLVFKGGTSLSKAWGIIDRFSEDIDIAIERSYFGFEGDLNRSEVKRLRKASCEFASIEFKAELENELHALGVEYLELSTVDFEDSDTDPIAIEIKYEPITPAREYLKSRILVEISSRSLREPFEYKKIQSHITETYLDKGFADEPISVPTVTPTRTLIEKMFLLHEEFQKPEGRKINSERKTRHLYDLDKLSETDYCSQALKDVDLYNRIIKHREMLTKISWVDYRLHRHETLNFIPPESVMREWEKDFQEMKESMFRGEHRSFAELIEKLRKLNYRFNSVALGT